MKQKNKTAVYELEHLRVELEREKKKIHVPIPLRKSRIEKERERQLLEQINSKNEIPVSPVRPVKGTSVPVKTSEQREASSIYESPNETAFIKIDAGEKRQVDSGQERAELSGQSPELKQLKQELKMEKYKSRYASVLRSTVGTLMVVAALAILVATLWMPVLQIYGSSMTPTLEEGQIVVSVKGADIEQGDLVAFYLGNKLLVKRVIAGPADLIDIGKDGTVSVNGTILDEPYISEKTLGECDLEFPYQVPDSRYFLMGDHRETSIDSRMSAVGCVAEEQMVGKIICCVWPVSDMNFFN